ncbi:Nucleoporin NUP56, partial [Colletotrichum shisoi]
MASTSRRDDYANPPLPDDDMIDPDDADLDDFDDPLGNTSSRQPLTGNIGSSSSSRPINENAWTSRIPGEDRAAPQNTIDESVWDTLRRDLLAVWAKMREVLYPKYLLGGTMFDADGIRGAYANIRGAGLSGAREEITGLASRFMDSEALLSQNNMTPGLRDWDLWGPLIFCLLLSILLSFNARADQKDVVFSGVFAMIWIGEAVVTLQIKLLGGSISFAQSVCIIGYTLFPLVIAALLSAFGIPTVARVPVYLFLVAWSLAAGVSILGGSGVVKNRVGIAVYPLFVFYLEETSTSLDDDNDDNETALPYQPVAMADDSQPGSPRSDPIDAKEDAETAAARKELKHTAISEKPFADGPTAETTPSGSQNEDHKERVSSPKKKRAHDQLDEDNEVDDADDKSVVSSDSAKDRALRLEPEKKRHRDEVATSTDTAGDISAPPAAAIDQKTQENVRNEGTSATSQDSAKDEKKGASTSAFASSGFAKLAASSASPFGSLGNGAKGSVFGGSASNTSSFGGPSPSKPAASPALTPTLSFGGAGAASSPFASVKPTGTNGGFGSAFGSAFGGGLGSKPLTSFSKTGESSFKTERAAKPFGAPDSDAEEGCDDDADDDAEAVSEPGDKEEREESDKEESKAVEDKKRTRLQKITVDDGEAGEATVLQVRAKIFYLEKEVGWKERGSGMLKINVPEACVQFDDAGLPIPGSFDASGLEEDPEAGDSSGHKVVRLIMRQDQTHRILLNTVILPAMQFQEKATLKSVGVMFTAFEGAEAKPVSVHVRMSAASAKSFLNE